MVQSHPTIKVSVASRSNGSLCPLYLEHSLCRCPSQLSYTGTFVCLQFLFFLLMTCEPFEDSGDPADTFNHLGIHV